MRAFRTSNPISPAAKLGTSPDLFFVRPGQELNVECSRDGTSTSVLVDNLNIVAVQVQETVGTFD